MPEEIKITTELDPYKKYKTILEAIREMEDKEENYLEEKSPVFPKGSKTRLITVKVKSETIKDKEDTVVKSIFAGLGNMVGVAEFCYGKQMGKTDYRIENRYRYMTQENVDIMLQKQKLAYEEFERIRSLK